MRSYSFHAGIVVATLAAVPLAACDGASATTTGEAGVAGAPPTFTHLYEDVLSADCIVTGGCHSGASRSGFLSFETREQAYEELFEAEAMGANCRRAGWTRVVPGHPEASLLLAKLEGTAGCGARMPSAESPLATEEIAAVRAWIAAGAPND